MGTLADELHHWALQEMHFRPQGKHVTAPIPSAKQLKPTVSKVKGNIRLKTIRSFGGQSETGSSKQQELVSELQSCLSAIGHIQREISRLHREIARSKSRLEHSEQHVKELRLRVELLGAHSLYLEEQRTMLYEYTRQIREKIQTLTGSSRAGQKVTFYSRAGRGSSSSVTDGSGDSDQLESACTRSVRKTCEDLESFLVSLLQPGSSVDKPALLTAKQTLCGTVGDVSREFCAAQLISSLCIHTQDTTAMLREKTSQIDIRRQAEALRFKYEQGGHLRDMSSQPSVLHSVRQLLEASQMDGIRRFVETEKHLNTAAELNDRLKHANEVLHKILHSHHGHDPALLQLVTRLVKAEQQLSVGQASLSVLHQVTSNLHQQMTQGARENEALLAKHNTIQDFKKIADSKQHLIRVLVKQNITARSRLDSRQQQILAYMDKALGDHNSDVTDQVTQLKNSVSREMDVFATLTLGCLLLDVLDCGSKKAVSDLSIHRLNHGLLVAGGDALNKICSALEFPPHKAPDEFLSHVVRLLQDTGELDLAIKTQREHDNNSDDTVECMADLRLRVNEQDVAQLNSLLPSLQKRVTAATTALNDCISIKDTALQWWEQPGQHCSGWVRVDDCTLQQWRDKWTVAATKLRQAHMSEQQ